MSVLDVFADSAFDVASLTEAIDKLPLKPGRLGQLGLYQESGVNTLTVQIEERHGKLALVQSAARGTRGTTKSRPKRQKRSFTIPHLPQTDEVLADEVQGVVAFGQETQLETISGVVNEKLQAMKNDHEVTWEWHRAGGIQGMLYDADGSVIYNWFDEFGITETEEFFDFSDDAFDIKQASLNVLRHVRRALGGTPHSGIHAMCGNTFFDQLTSHPTVKEAFDRWQDGLFFREQQATMQGGFPYAGITWENYDWWIGGQQYIPEDVARFFPTGTTDLFLRKNGPADYVETVNTMGRSLYAKQERMDFDKGIDLESQSNPLHLCSRPAALVKGVIGTPPTTTTTT